MHHDKTSTPYQPTSKFEASMPHPFSLVLPPPLSFSCLLLFLLVLLASFSFLQFLFLLVFLASFSLLQFLLLLVFLASFSFLQFLPLFLPFPIFIILTAQHNTSPATILFFLYHGENVLAQRCALVTQKV